MPTKKRDRREYCKKYFESKKYDLDYKFRQYERGALNRGIDFQITKEEFSKFVNNKCLYCGEIIDGYGLDRVDSTCGYTIENTVPCCEICNRMKMRHGKELFIEHCKKVAINNK